MDRHDANGNRASQVERRTDAATQVLGAAETTEYGYDGQDRLIGVRYPDETTTLYNLDGVGNRRGERRAHSSVVPALTVAAFAALSPADALADVAYQYNRADWVLSSSDSKDPSRERTYAYDANGNLVQKTSPTSARELAWDIRDTLTAVYDDTAEVGRYDYDWKRQRTRRTTQEAWVEYVLDGHFVLEEGNGSVLGTPTTRRYHYGAGEALLVQDVQQEVAGDGAAGVEVGSFLHHDGLGSVSTLSTAAGEVADTRAYDAWGNYRNDTEPSGAEPKLGYTGHQYDTETGLTYARARYYDSELGRFIGRDSYEGELENAPSLHRYVYAHGNPLTYVDPSGNCVNFFSGEVVSVANCVESGKALAGFGLGVLKTAGKIVAAPGVLTYNVTGAALHALTGESQYAGQAQSFNEGVQGFADAVSDPGQVFRNAVEGVKGQAAGIADAIERGDAFAAGEGTGTLTAEAVLALEGGISTVQKGATLARKLQRGRTGVPETRVPTPEPRPAVTEVAEGGAGTVVVARPQPGSALQLTSRSLEAADIRSQRNVEVFASANRPRTPSGTVGDSTPDRISAAKGIQSIPSKQVSFSQSSVTGVAEIEASMRARGWVGDPIDVVRMADGRLVTIDNTRLLAAHRAAIDVRAVVHEAGAALPTSFVERFTTRKGGVPSTWGDAINNRLGAQSAPYRQRYPQGSFTTGSTE